jgi:hypothetical protein
MIYAEAITCGGQPLNSYKEIRDWALIRYSGDSRMSELADNAYRSKVFLERSLLCSTANLMPMAMTDPEMTFVAPIANLFHPAAGMKKHVIYPRKGFVQMPFKPGVREFYWERTIPSLIRCLAGRDIHPMILDIFFQEIHDYLIGNLSNLIEHQELTDEQVHKILDTEMILSAIGILEHCIWFMLTYQPNMFSRYDWLQMRGPFGKERVNVINEEAKNILYGDEQLISERFNKYSLANIEERVLETISTLVIALAMYGTPATTVLEKELLKKGHILCEKMLSALSGKRQYQDACLFYTRVLENILKSEGVKPRPFWKFW